MKKIYNNIIEGIVDIILIIPILVVALLHVMFNCLEKVVKYIQLVLRRLWEYSIKFHDYVVDKLSV